MLLVCVKTHISTTNMSIYFYNQYLRIQDFPNVLNVSLSTKNKERKINCKTLIANFRSMLLVFVKRYINNTSIYCCNQCLKLLFWVLRFHWKQNLQPLNNKTALWWWNLLWNQPFAYHLDILKAKNMKMAKLVLIKLLLLCKVLNDVPPQNLCSILAGKANLNRCSNRLELHFVRCPETIKCWVKTFSFLM